MKNHLNSLSPQNPIIDPDGWRIGRRRFQTPNLSPAQASGRSVESTRSLARRAVCSGLLMVLAVVALGPSSLLHSQEYTFTTLAGVGGGPGAVDGTGAGARFVSPTGVAVDSAGNVYVADTYNYTIRKIAPGGVVTTLAGLAGRPGAANGMGSAARFKEPSGIAVDGAGNVYVADRQNDTIQKITAAGVVTTLAGRAGQSGSTDGAGSAARFNQPDGVAVDSAGNVYVADGLNHTIRKITPIGLVTTLAGVAGSPGSVDGTGNEARFNFPFGGVAVDAAGNVYVADFINSTIRKVTSGGVVTTLAGSAGQGGSTDGTGSAARFNGPPGVAVDSGGNVYVADDFNQAIRKITPDGVVTTLAGDPTVLDADGNPLSGYADGAPRAARFSHPVSVAVDGAGNVYVADADNHSVREVTPGGTVTTLAGAPTLTGSNDGTGSAARFNYPTALGVDKADNIFVADAFNHTIRKVTAGGVVTTFAGLAGSPGSDDGPSSVARLNYPAFTLADNAGGLYVADGHNQTIRQVSSAGVVTTLAGAVGVSGADDGAARVARFNQPRGMVLDSAGNLYVVDRDNHTVRKMTPAGEVTTLAGMAGIPGSANGTGTAAQFNSPRGLAIDSAGNLYVADSDNHAIRKVTPAGVVTTFAGLAGTSGSANGTRTAARFTSPYGIAADSADNLYVGDTGNNTIRKVTPVGVVTTLAGLAPYDANGNYVFGSSGSADGAGSVARFNQPGGMGVDSAGNLYVADSFNNTIRVGTTNTAPDKPTIDLASGPALQKRQLDTSPQTASAWQWRIIRRPANSVAAFSDPNARNPTFTPDVADLFIFELKATSASGAICIRTISLAATPTPQPTIVVPSLALANGPFNLTIQSLAGNAVEIQTSPDLSNWTTVSTLTNLTGTASFTDPGTSLQRGFYRLRQL